MTPVQSNGHTAFEHLTGDKQFHGDLEAASKVEMLGFRPPIKGSGVYVALELVTGTLNGKQGSFVLQHSGSMRGGATQITVTVVPDSGTGELTGISGQLKILFEADGSHAYEFDYTIE